MYGLMYGLSHNARKQAAESKKPPEGGCAWRVRLVLVSPD
jgi:hypothetical protein